MATVIIIGVAGPHMGALTLDVSEMQALVAVDGVPQEYEQHIFMLRIDGGKWIVADSDLNLSLLDIADEEVVPLARAAPFPAPGRPYLGIRQLSDQEVSALRLAARRLGELHGVKAPTVLPTGGSSSWLFSDTALESFGQVVSGDLQADANVFIPRGRCALVSVGTDWSVAELVPDAGVESWLISKREGHGRDKRLSSVKPTSSGSAPLFRDCVEAMKGSTTTNCCPRIFGTSPSSITEALEGLSRSGLEPSSFCVQWITASGISPKSSVAIEFHMLLHFLYCLASADRLDLSQLAGAEHGARRLLQIQKAVQKNHKAPDFSGLSYYTKHCDDLSGVIRAPAFERHVAQEAQSEANILKQFRLSREEQESVEKAKVKKGKGDGKDDTK
jgi:hypothetical protein